MLKFLIIQLDRTSVSFCHCYNEYLETGLIPLETLKEAIVWSMKENLTLQFVYPDYELPQEYKDIIFKTYRADIVSSTCRDEHLRHNADVVVFETWANILLYPFLKEQTYVIRTSLADLLTQKAVLGSILPSVNRINVVLTDIESFLKEDEDEYAKCLEYLSYKIKDEYKKGHNVQLNLLTDRMLLDKMNNCGAGEESITLGPDGNFYVCPAFYLDKEENVYCGNIYDGLDVKNPQLYRLDHAPICRVCDAFHCRRCIWLNRRTTLEVNTSSHQQCVVAHIERNAARQLYATLREIGISMPDIEINEIDYLDPFDKALLAIN